MYSHKEPLIVLATALLFAALPLVAKSEPPSSQPERLSGGQTTNGRSENPNQMTNRDANQPALRQKQEINNTSPDFPTAMNPASGNLPATQPMVVQITPTTRPATTRTSNPTLDTANDAVQQAQSIYDHQRQKVIAGLQKNREYRAVVAQRNADAAKIPTPSPTTEASQNILNAASAKLNSSEAVTELQERAISADPTAAAAKKNLERAVTYRNRITSQASTRP